MSRAFADLVRTGVCKTTAKHRPWPSLFYFPGLTSKPWHDPKDHDWIERLRVNAPVIRQEYEAIRAKSLDSDYKLQGSEHALHEGSWEWFSYISKGETQDRFAQECPVTTALLESIPRLMRDVPFAFTFFSTLEPGSKIAPHTSPANLRLRCHLPLIVPEGCSIRVADETREWVEGEPLLFDDAFEHEVVHSGTEPRVILLVDTWHPDLATDEIRAVCDMFQRAKDKGWMK